MQEVEVSEKRLSDYRSIIGPAATEELVALGKKLEGKRVAHVNVATSGCQSIPG